jgi:hypothetical protein
VGWFSADTSKNPKSPVTTIGGVPVTDPKFTKTPTVVPATPAPPPSTPAIASSNVTDAQDAAAKQRKRAVAGDTLLTPKSDVNKAPGPRFNKLTLVGGG